MYSEEGVCLLQTKKSSTHTEVAASRSFPLRSSQKWHVLLLNPYLLLLLQKYLNVLW